MKKLHLIILTTTFLSISCNKKETNLNDNSISVESLNDSLNDNVQNSQKDIQAINQTILYFKEKNIDKIATIINYPLEREHPIPAIENEDDFKRRFNEIFDDHLIQMIANSTAKDWEEVGWRGSMLESGEVWMANSDGIITTINYQSEEEKKLKKDLIVNEKNTLHSSINNFIAPIYKLETNDTYIRIDDLGNDNYRYSSWKLNAEKTSKPEEMITKGVARYEGSLNVEYLTFKKGTKTIIISDNLGEGDHPKNLEILVNNKTILETPVYFSK